MRSELRGGDHIVSVGHGDGGVYCMGVTQSACSFVMAARLGKDDHACGYRISRLAPAGSNNSFPSPE